MRNFNALSESDLYSEETTEEIEVHFWERKCETKPLEIKRTKFRETQSPERRKKTTRQRPVTKQWEFLQGTEPEHHRRSNEFDFFEGEEEFS